MTGSESSNTYDSDRPQHDAREFDDDGPMVVFECAVPAEELALEGALGTFPDVDVEYERLVPANNSPLPYLWTTDEAVTGFGDSIADDPNVERVETAATFDAGALYRIEWQSDRGALLSWLANTHEDIALLQAEGCDDEWTLKFRFPSRASLAEFRTFAEEEELGLRIIRLYDLTDPKMGEYNISQKQREALVLALEMGHFEVPREATLEEIADSLDISAKALSERLRRGQMNLVNNTLTFGRPSGVGVGE